MTDATLFLAPTLDAAQRHALAQHAAWPHALLLLPDRDSRQRLLRAAPALDPALVGFYDVAHRLLAAAGEPPRALRPATARRLLHRLLDEMSDEGRLSSFGPLRRSPGLIETLRDWLREMKTQGIAPDTVAAAARAQPNPRDEQLAELYRRYQDFLHEQRLMDDDGMLWLAAEALERGTAQPTEPLIVLGFDQLNPLQQRILAAWPAPLAICLLWDGARPAESLALTRLRTTRQALAARFGGRLREERLEAPASDDGPLAYLVANLFEQEAAPLAEPPAALEAVAAPSREGEVRHALRQAKRLLLDGVPPQEIALLAPDPECYGRIVTTVAAEYGLPVAVARPLLLNPAIATLTTLLGLTPTLGWRATFELLRSPYLAQPWLDEEQVDQLERLTRERPVVQGRAAWWHALDPLSPDAFHDPDESRRPLAARLSPEALGAIRSGLGHFFDLATPPRSGTARDHARWLQRTVLGLGVADDEPSFHLATRALAGPHAARDHAALTALLRVVDELVLAAQEVPPRQPLSWATFHGDLAAALAGTRLRPDGAEAALRFAAIEEGRTLDVAHLFVLGLSEGDFPRPPRADPLYAPLERLAEAGLPLRRPDPGEEASIWWQLIGNVRDRLTLLRPRLDESGNGWEPSPYWEEIVRLLPALGERVRLPAIGAPPRPDEAACPREYLLAVAAAGGTPLPPDLRWARVQAGSELLAQRSDPARPAGRFEGEIADDELRALLSQRFHRDHRWSASRLGSYAACPYGFFAREVLKLEPLPTPSEGLTAMQRGSLLHAALESLFTRLTERDMVPCAANEGSILAALDELLGGLLERAPQRFGFQPDALWQEEKAELRRLLAAVVRHSCAEESAFRPLKQELAFGDAPALWLESADGTRRLRLHGVIDRIDADEQGHLRIIDYKSGSASYSAEDIREGRALQSALYGLAAEQLLGQPVVESSYFHLPTRRASGQIRPRGPLAEEALVQAALERALDHADAIRAGHFPSAPTSEAGCRDGCDFVALCRASRATLAKARQHED